jgi:hypothetical protein
MPARRQKRPEELQGRGSRHAGTTTLQLVPPDAGRPVPGYPDGLAEHLRAVWDAFWSDAISQRLTPADMYDVGQYFGLLQERDALLQVARRKTITKGSMEQDVLNPRFRRIEQITAEIKVYREQLGILPLSRSRLGWETARAESGFLDLQRKWEERHGEMPAVIDLDELG